MNGDSFVEVGAVELVNRSPIGHTFHRYLCPECDVPADARAVHGLTAYLRRRLDTFINPLVYPFWGTHGPSIMTLSAGLAE